MARDAGWGDHGAAGVRSRRAFLRLAAAGAASVALAACGTATGPTATSGAGAATSGGGATSAGGSASAATATRPAVVTVAGGATLPTPTAAGATAAAMTAPVKRGGRIVEASVLAVPTWDVHYTNTVVTGHVLCFENLLRYELVDEAAAKFELRPGLAEKWEQPDPQTIVLTLRKGVKFHDGSDLNAEVVKWNLDRIAKDPKSNARAQFTAYDSTEVLDAGSVRIKLKSPSASFLPLLSNGGGQTKAMMSKVHFEKVGADEFGRNPSGTGPYRVKSWVQEDRVVMEPFKDYWDKGADGRPLPYADEFVGRYIPDLTTATVELQSGGVDLVRDLPPKDVVTVRANPNLVLQGLPWSATQYFDTGFNLDKPPFNNVKVRQAVLYGMDREAMVKAVGFGSGAALLYPYWVPGSLGYDTSIPNYAYNPDKAKQLLTEAGQGGGIDFELKFIQREPDATAAQLQQQVWAKLGMRVKLFGMERLAWIDDMKARKFDVGIWRGSFPLDPDFQNFVTTGAASNYSGFSDMEIDNLMKEGGATLDPKARAVTYGKVLTRLFDQAYVGSGFQVPTIYAYRKNLRGVGLQFAQVDLRAAWKE